MTLYSQADAEAFGRLSTHLAPLLERNFPSIEHIHRGSLLPGETWARLDQQLQQADVVVCLLSADFFSEQEGIWASRALGDPRVAVVPVWLSAFDLRDTPFAEVRLVPTDGPLKGSADEEGGWAAVVSAVRDQLCGSDRPMRDLLRRDRDDLLARVEQACHLQEGQPPVTLMRRRGPPPFSEFTEVRYKERRRDRLYLLASLPHPPLPEDIATLATLLQERYRAYDPLVDAVLVYIGEPAAPEVQALADQASILAQPLAEYQGLIEFAGYLRWQSSELEQDQNYPPSLYVTQRMAYSRGLARQRETEVADALAEITSWLLVPRLGRLVLVLGDFGVGKTFLLKQLARRMTEVPGGPVPVLLEMSSLEKARTLDELVAQHLAHAGMEHIRPGAFRYMLREGRIALLFDGFDELALRVSYERAVEHLGTILSAAEGLAKVVLSSRTQHFRADAQVRTPLAERLSGAEHRGVRLQSFEEAEIRTFLLQMLGDKVQADRRYRLIRDVKDLLGLSQNPRMLGFIARLPEKDLQKAKKIGPVTAAKLYQLLLEQWLVHEYRRAHPPGIEPGLTVEQRWRAVEHLAIHLWAQTERTVHVDLLAAEVGKALTDLNNSHLVAVAAQQVGSGTLLCRNSEGRFSFIHQSVLEWLVARAAVTRRNLLSRSEMSLLMADFFIDLAGPEQARAWVSEVLADPAAEALAKDNALILRQRLRDTGRGVLLLRGQDLRGKSFARQSLAGADLRQADLRGVDLSWADLAGADLREANLTGANLMSADLTLANFKGARLVRARLVGAKGAPTALTGCDLWGAATMDAAGMAPMSAGMTGMASIYLKAELALSPDGSLLAVPADDNKVRLWDVQSGQELRVLAGHQGRVWNVSFSPDSRTLASGSSDDTVRLWDVQSGQELRVLAGHQGRVWSVSFSPDSRTLASGSDDSTVRLWDVQSGQELRVLAGHQDRVLSVSFSSDGCTLASGSDDSTVRLWDVQSGQELRTLTGHEGRVLSVSFSSDGCTLASGSDDSTVRLWHAQSGQELRTLTGHKGRVLSVSFSSDGLTLASGTGDSTVWLWDAQSGQKLRVLTGPQGRVLSVSFSSDGRILASGSDDNTVRLWDVQSGQELRALAEPQGRVLSVSFNSDGRILASGSDDDTVRLWDVQSGQALRVLSGHQGSVLSVSFSSAGRSLASGSDDNTVRLWNVQSGQELRTLTGHKGRVLSVSFSPDRRSLASGSADSTVRLWDVQSRQALRVLAGHQGRVLSVSFSNDSGTIASGSDDNTVRLWDVQSGQAKGVLFGHQGRVLSVSFSNDGRTLASGSDDNTVRLWDVQSGQAKRVLAGHQGRVLSVSFNDKGRILASVSDDNTVRLWDVQSDQEPRVLAGPQGRVLSVSFSPDNRTLASSTGAGTIQLWDVGTGRHLATLISSVDGWAVVLPDGRYKMSGHPGSACWHAIGLCRFELGELDPHLPQPLRLPDDHPLF